ncbi:MAG: hypothetical protein AAF492_07205, partial [Verrucomicrobiota bacterium]
MGISSATPLDDRISAFKDATVQSESDVGAILRIGLREQRAAEAFAAVQTWLSANPTASPTLLFDAARAAEFAGEWTEAVSFYRKLLKSKALNSNVAAKAVPAVYRLLLIQLNDPDAAYLFMREDGNRLRSYGQAGQFDRWFLQEAGKRRDLAATARRLATIHANPRENPEDYDRFMSGLYEELEKFDVLDSDAVEALDQLSLAATREPGFEARWTWINAVSRYIPEASSLVGNRKQVPVELLTEPMKAARTLLAADPLGGASLVMKGWSRWNQGDTPTFFRFAHAHRGLKAEPFLKALTRLQPAEAKRLLNQGARGPRGRWVSVAGLISPEKARSVVPRYPSIFNAIDAPNTPLWDAKMSVAEAKALAPHIARNPHPDAALVRAYAVAGTNHIARLLPVIAASESWRFTGDHKTSAARRMVDMVWNSGCDRSGFDHGQAVKEYEELFNRRLDPIRKQIAKDSDSATRMATFDKVYRELRGTPSTPTLIGLWDDLGKAAPIPDKIQILTRLSSDFHAAIQQTANASDPASIARRERQRYLLERAAGVLEFGNGYAKMRVRPDMRSHDFGVNWSRYGKNDLRKNGAGMAKHLGTLLNEQMAAGTLSEPMLGMWLSSVDPKDTTARTLIKDLVQSPAYAKVPRTYREVAAHQELFGHIA